MKKLSDTYIGIFVLIACMAFASCNGGNVVGSSVDNQGHWIPVTDSTGKITSNVLQFDTVLYLKPSFAQKMEIAKHDHSEWEFITFLVIGILLLGYGLYRTTKAQANDWTNLIWPILGIVCLMVSYGSVEWAIGKEVSIPKTLYDSISTSPTLVKDYMETQLFK